jgi:3',5'-cyclic-AMP phosphodiesterase
MSDNKQEIRIDRRGVLECMIWAGTGVIWTLSGGVPKSSQLLGIETAQAAEKAAAGFSFLQISDSHVGFNKPANPDALGTLKEAIGKVNGLLVKPAFMIHTGDITHLSKPGQFDDAEKVIGEAKLDVHYVPGEHDVIDEENGKAYLERYGKHTKGTGWYSFDASGVHFIGLVNVANLKAGGMGSLGDEQLFWLADDLKSKPTSTPVVVFAHIPLWTISADWGWGTEDSARALALLKRFGSVTVLNGHIHQLMQKVEGNVTFHTAMSTAFPQPAPGTAASPGPMLVPAEKLRTLLGLTSVEVRRGTRALAITDSPLAVS